MKRTAVVLAGLALSGTLVACSDDETPTSSVSDTAAASASASAAADGGAGDADEGEDGAEATAAPLVSSGTPGAAPSPAGAPADGAAPVPFPGSTGLAEQSATGGPLSVVAVRVAPQDGYDRVVFELDGTSPGQPGWRVQYVDDPSRQGSGDPVELEGAAALHVSISGTGYPMDTGVEEYSGEPTLPSGLGAVRDLELGAVFEGEYEAFIGVAEATPFRVFRLADPARVVVDLRTG